MKRQYRYSWQHNSWCIFLPWLGGYLVMERSEPAPPPAPPFLLIGNATVH